MLDFFLIIDNTFKPSLNKDNENDIHKYQKIKKELTEKQTRIKTAFINGLLEPTTLQTELNEIERQLTQTNNKLIELEQIKNSNQHNQDISTIFNLKEIEKLKQKSEYVRTHNLWNKLSKEQKQYLINKYIDEIEIDIDKNYNVSILNITFNKNEIENIGYMFRQDCFDMVINIKDHNVILSNFKNEQQTNSYIQTLRNFYNIKTTTIEATSFDINNFITNDIIQIIPQKSTTKFDEKKFTILQIEV